MSRPNFGVFVERQARELASRPDVSVTVVAPIGMPPWPLSRAGRYAPLRALPPKERWKDLTVYRPTFPIIPKFGGRTKDYSQWKRHASAVRRANGLPGVLHLVKGKVTISVEQQGISQFV